MTPIFLAMEKQKQNQSFDRGIPKSKTYEISTPEASFLKLFFAPC
jgi:hypothetical protein